MSTFFQLKSLPSTQKPDEPNLSRQKIIGAVKAMKKRERESFLEELLAAPSPEYLESIQEARADYKTGRVKTHEEVFGT